MSGVDLDAVGRRTEPLEVSWDSTRCLLYAIGVGAGSDASLDELAFVTENTPGVPQRVLPTFPVILGFGGPRPNYGDVDRTKVVHAEQSVQLLAPLPVEGHGTLVTGIDAIYDKGSGALLTTSSVLTGADGTALVELRGGIFVKGSGGFGGDRGPVQAWTAPDRAPDVVVEQPTLPGQALIYRLSGDRNPMHSDPAFAARAGFDRPILHGLCTYGFAGRAVLHAAADSAPDRLTFFGARFSSPVFPGDVLRTSIWRDDDEVLFTTATDRGVTVLANGRATIGPPAGDRVGRRSGAVGAGQ